MSSRKNGAIPLLILIMLAPNLFPGSQIIGPSAVPVHATPQTGLGIWSSVYNSSAVVNSGIAVGTVMQFRVNASGGTFLNGFDITVNWTSTTLKGIDITAEGPALGLALLNDPILRYSDTNNNNSFNLGEPVIYDADNGGTYTAGDTVVSGTAPAIDAPLKNDPKARFVDDNNNSLFNLDEAVIFDADSSSSYNAVDTAITHTHGIFSGLNYFQISKEVAPDHVRLVGAVLGPQAVANNTALFFTVEVLAINSTALAIPPHLEGSLPAGYTSISAETVNNLPYENLNGFFSNDPAKSDLVLSSVSVQNEIVTKGDPLAITVTVSNVGSLPMADITIRVYTNDVIIDSTTITALAPDTDQSVTIIWNTGSFSLGTYNVTATAVTTSPDAYLGDNRQSLETVRVVTHNLKLDDVTVKIKDNIVQTVKVNTSNATIAVTVANLGTIEDLANVTVYANNTRINNIRCQPLAGGQSQCSKTGIPGNVDPGRTQTFAFAWNTSAIAPGFYNITAEVSPVLGETNLNDNMFVYGFVAVVLNFTHDLAVIGSFPPENIKQGDNATLTFTLRNKGSSDETYDFKVFLTNETAGFSVLLNQTMGSIAAFRDVPLLVKWKTKGFSLGIYHGVANVSLAVDENPADNEIAGNMTLGQNLPLPIASFVFTPANPQIGTNVFFDASSSNDPDGISYYIWDFGDGTTLTVTTNSTSHTYTSSGTFPVTLRVWDNYGAIGSASKNITVAVKQEVPLVLYVAIGAVGAAAAAGAIIFVAKRRKALSQRHSPDHIQSYTGVSTFTFQ